MKNWIFVIGILVLFSACNQNIQQVKNKMADTIYTDKNSIQYICQMHPEIVKNKPGTCEKCGMDLVEKQAN